MSITHDSLINANARMLGKTNRAILFAKVNLDTHLDPETRLEATPTLADLLPSIRERSSDEFLDAARRSLTVTSFRDFLEKFDPGFYYCVTNDRAAQNSGGDEPEGAAESGDNPRLAFSLKYEGKGWKKVRLTVDHPYIRCLSDLIKKRVRQDISTFRVDVDASMFAFKPRSQRMQMRKLAEDMQVKTERLMLEAGRNKTSKDTQRALEAYESTSGALQDALEDAARVLPTIVYGLEQVARELKSRGARNAGDSETSYQIEFGSDRSRLHLASPPAGSKETPAPAKNSGGKALPADGMRGTALAKTDDMALARTGAEGNDANRITAPAQNTMSGALGIIRAKNEQRATAPLNAEAPQGERFALTIGKFMDKMIARGNIQPLLANMLVTVLQENAGALAELKPELAEVEQYHRMFLDIYSAGIEEFLNTVTPLLETVMGVYLLFNEFPAEVRLPESRKPELIIANADLVDLMETRPEELKEYFNISCAQAANQFQDAISFVIVPSAAPFIKKRKSKRAAKDRINVLDDDFLSDIRAAQQESDEDDGQYGRAVYLDEMTDLMDWGLEYGFQVLFSPEERVRAGRIRAGLFDELNDAYAIDSVISKPSADCAVMCVPDFVLMPPDGRLITGKYADGSEVSVRVPELSVRACFVAAGRLMANDLPEYLGRKIKRARKTDSLRNDLPGVGVDLSKHTYLGETDLPTDHFLGDSVLDSVEESNKPFAVFTHVTGASPRLSVPRTMRRVHNTATGDSAYRHLHLFRQEVYLRRLLRAADKLDGGAWPADDAEAAKQLKEAVDWMLEWSGWHDPVNLVNSFPGELEKGSEFVARRQGKNHFEASLGFAQGINDSFTIMF